MPHGVTPLNNIVPVVSWRTRLAHVRMFRQESKWGIQEDGLQNEHRELELFQLDMHRVSNGCWCRRFRPGAFVRVYDEQFKTPLGDAPVIGSICMDQIAVDLTDIPEKGSWVWYRTYF